MPKAGKEKQGLRCLWVAAPHFCLGPANPHGIGGKRQVLPGLPPLATEAGETKQWGPL